MARRSAAAGSCWSLARTIQRSVTCHNYCVSLERISDWSGRDACGELLFVCKGVSPGGVPRRNPRLRPGEQKYCPLRRCQRLRKTLGGWASGRGLPGAAAKSKSSWRQAHSKEDAAYRRAPELERAAIDGRVQAGAGVMPSSRP